MIDKNIFKLELAECINEAFNMSLEDVVQHVSEMTTWHLTPEKTKALSRTFLHACSRIYDSSESSYTYKEALKTAEFFYKKLRKYQGLD